MTLRIQARRAGSVSEQELVYIGELFYDDELNRFGVFSNEDATTIRWMPRWVGNDLILNANQKLSGMVSDEDVNNIALDFTSPGSVKFKNTLTNEIYLEITPNGIVFLKANDTITEIAGTSNLAINGNLSIVRTVGELEHFTTQIDGNVFMFAPNWYVYSYISSAGMLTFTYENNDVITDDLILDRALKVTSSGNVSECGVRSFFYDYKFVQDRFITVTLRVKGPEGSVAYSRVLTENNSQLAIKTIVGTGKYETISYPCFIPPSSSTWWAVDSLYEPGKNESVSTDWLVGGLQVNLGTTSGIIERRSKQVEKSLVNTLYTEGRLFIDETDIEYPVTLDSFIANPDRVDVVNPEDGTPSITDKNTSGFNLSILGTSSSKFIVKYAAYSAPFPNP